MNAKAKILGSAAALALAAACYTVPAGAVAISCKDLDQNYMKVDSAYVSSCINAGLGNIGNGQNDDFLIGGGTAAGWTDIGGGTFQQLSVDKDKNSSGTFSFNSSLWTGFQTLAIGFKFGTGNEPDNWFVYELQNLVSSGSWTFMNTFGKGEGMSHVEVYGGKRTTPPPPTSVPEPATLSMLGLGLLGLGFAARRRKV